MNVSNGLDAAILAVTRTAADHADEVDRASRIPEEAVRALQAQAMMGLLVPAALGGPARRMSQVAGVCHALGQSCGSSAMIFAMHQIQVACIVAHGAESDWHFVACLQRVEQGIARIEPATAGDARDFELASPIPAKAITTSPRRSTNSAAGSARRCSCSACARARSTPCAPPTKIAASPA
jgi:hypothetical protein